MLSRNYVSLNPSQSKTTQSSVTFRTRRSRASSFSTLEPLPGCLPFETIRMNRMSTNYNLKKQHLRQVSKENIAMMIRISNQKSSYQSIGKTAVSKECKVSNFNQVHGKGQKRRISIVWKNANKENLQQIDKILTARDKQIKLLTKGKNIFGGTQFQRELLKSESEKSQK